MKDISLSHLMLTTDLANKHRGLIDECCTRGCQRKPASSSDEKN